MIKKLLIPVLITVPFFAALAQDNIEIEYTDTPPLIDGVIDDLWDNAIEVPIEREFQDEQPTVTATWKALWDDDYIYVIIDVFDEDHYPAWEAGGSWYEYDQTEIYLDVNQELKDGRGPGAKGTGHYQALGLFGETLEEEVNAMDSSNYRTGGNYCYLLYGDDYTVEYAIKISSMMDIDSIQLSADDLKGLGEIGFDITVIDQDEGDTESRQRAVWQNEGDVDENYNNMDDAGTITLVDELVGVGNTELNAFSVYPNPANDFITVEESFNAVAVFNACGQKMSDIRISDKQIDISALPEGLYMLKVYKGEEITGTAKFVKK